MQKMCINIEKTRCTQSIKAQRSSLNCMLVGNYHFMEVLRVQIWPVSLKSHMEKKQRVTVNKPEFPLIPSCHLEELKMSPSGYNLQ